ncbi:hypothetical protein [Streptomyces sp. SAI-229]
MTPDARGRACASWSEREPARPLTEGRPGFAAGSDGDALGMALSR